jgi:hypothetical protein
LNGITQKFLKVSPSQNILFLQIKNIFCCHFHKSADYLYCKYIIVKPVYLSLYRDNPTGCLHEFRYPVRLRGLCLLQNAHTGSRPVQSPIRWVPEATLPEVKLPGLKDDHSSLSCGDGKKGEAAPPLPIRLYDIVLN